MSSFALLILLHLRSLHRLLHFYVLIPSHFSDNISSRSCRFQLCRIVPLKRDINTCDWILLFLLSMIGLGRYLGILFYKPDRFSLAAFPTPWRLLPFHSRVVIALIK